MQKVPEPTLALGSETKTKTKTETEIVNVQQEERKRSAEGARLMIGGFLAPTPGGGVSYLVLCFVADYACDQLPSI